MVDVGELPARGLPSSSSHERGFNKMPTTKEKSAMSLDEVAARENEDLAEADAQRDMRIEGEPVESRTLYLHGIETLTE